jgi:hypothetical protein
MKYAYTILFFFILPFLVHGQVKTVSPSDSLKKYQKLAMRDRDSLNRYNKLKDTWSATYYHNLSEKRRWQINHWNQQKELFDKLKQNGNK